MTRMHPALPLEGLRSIGSRQVARNDGLEGFFGARSGGGNGISQRDTM